MILIIIEVFRATKFHEPIQDFDRDGFSDYEVILKFFKKNV